MVRLVSTLTVAVIASILLFGAYLIGKKGWKLSRFSKPAAIILAFVMFARYIYHEPAIYYLTKLANGPFGDNAFKTVIGILLVWFAYAAMLTTVVNEFFDSPTLNNIVRFFSLPVWLLIIIFYDTYLVSLFGLGAMTLSTGRIWFVVLELALGISIPLSKVIIGENAPLPKGKKEIGNIIYALTFALIAIMPCYTLQAFIGNSIDPTIKLYDFTEEHRFMVYFAFVIPFIIYQLLKDKSYETKRLIMTYLSVALMWVYIGRWNLEELKMPYNWPLHLCNTAMFIIPLCIIFKMKRLFNFTLFVNVMGAFLAMMLPNEISGTNAIGTERVSFWLNHYAAFFMPILLVALGLFNRPKFKEWIYSVIAFVVYFISMLFVNPYFDAKYNSDSDFFFLNSDFIVSNLGKWAEDTREFVLNITIGEYEFVFYPLYQTLFFLVYIGFTVGIWFLYGLLFRTWDAAKDRRLRERDYKRMKKELKEYLGGRSIHEPVSGDASPRLVLKNFSKRYGSNKHYSVHDVSFEVKGGEIFGFLGPNGAGKSTIIKSMVGIQTITSGDIEICGFNVDKQPVQAKLHTGFVPDHYALYENLTGREYINYIADLFQVNYEYRNEIIEKYVERFQLTGSFDNQMKTYSHGMKQKITIMAALVHNPKVWILDEPLTGLDPTSIHEVKECMKEHAANGNIVFFSSHIIDVVEKICDRIAIIKKGQLRACTTIKELDEKGIELEQFYLDIINDGNDAPVFVEDAKDLTSEEAIEA